MLVKNKNNKNKFITGLVLAVFLATNLFSPVFLLPKPVKAFGPGSVPVSFSQDVDVPKPTPPSPGSVITGSFQEVGNKLLEWWRDQKAKIVDTILNVAVKNSLHYFFNTLAYDTATYLASGGQGQKPLFYTQGWGPYLTDVADNAAGHFIEGLAKGQGWGNLCQPRFGLKAYLSLGLKQTVRPQKPACSWTELQNNWETLANDPDFLRKIQPMFNPWENDLGIALGVYTNFFTAIAYESSAKDKERQEGGLFKSIKDTSGKILTPAPMIGDWVDNISDATLQDAVTLVGEPIADAVGVFTNTLAGKFLERVFLKGLASLRGTDEDKYDWGRLESLTSPTAGAKQSGVAEARQEFANFLTNSFVMGDPNANRLDVTAQLFYEGLISPQFKTAVDQKLTVQQAIDQGLLTAFGPGATFGYSAADKQPEAREGYAHDALIILRKYRILPVGWEIAASYIKQNFQEKIYGLGEIIAAYDDSNSPFYRLVDPNWVLKAPATFCRLSGPGDKLAMDTWTEETVYNNAVSPPTSYKFNRHLVGRQDSCVDSKSCLYEDSAGNCLYYGYCTEEKPVWRFPGQSCPSYYESCQSFTGQDSQVFNYLGNTLASGNCNADNVGCGWNCADYNGVSGNWACVAGGEKTHNICEPAAGCPVVDAGTGRTCTIPPGGISCTVPSCSREANKVANPGFETTAPRALAAGWSYGIRMTPDQVARVSGRGEKVASGAYALKMFSAGGTAALTAFSGAITLDAEPKVYTLSAQIFNNLNQGKAYLELVNVARDAAGNVVYDAAGNPTISSLAFSCQTNTDISKNLWQTVSCDFTGPANQTVFILIKAENNGVAPNGTVWVDNVSLQSACPSADITVYLASTVDTPSSKQFFDRDAQECSFQEDGCQQLISLQPNTSANLIVNGSFENWDGERAGWPDGWSLAGVGTTASRELEGAPLGGSFLKISGAAPAVQSAIIKGLQAEKSYRVSFYAKAAAATILTVNLLSQPANNSQSLIIGGNPINLTTAWQRFVVDTVPAAINGYDFKLSFSGAGEISLDGVQIEPVTLKKSNYTAYKEYGAAGLTYLKTPPPSLRCTGNPDTDHASCQNYAGKCLANEVGCALYTPTNGDPTVPGLTQSYDFCPAECNGYQAFKQKATKFETEPAEFFYFIPDTGQECTEGGCTEFTNLDAVAQGGEGKEYYTELRQCRQPQEAGAACQTFYSWIGSDVTGYQLQTHSLIDADGVADGQPDEVGRVAADGACAQASDALTNLNCREFYSAGGQVSYKIFERTTSCSDDCHPYRLASITAEADCKQPGQWDRDGNQCLYDVIPSQGVQCSASENGCRLYSGNAGANVRTIFFDNFEDNQPASRWQAGTGELSGEATVVGGHSFKTTTGEIETQDGILTINKEPYPAGSYFIQFWAKAAPPFGNQHVNVSLENLTAGASVDLDGSADGLALSSNWQLYTLPAVPVTPTAELTLKFEMTSGQAYFDNITLKLVADQLYLIKNSWQTPASCDTDLTGKSAPQFMLGCQEYYEAAGATVYLKSFNKLCRDAAVGCQAFLDTQNSTSPFSQNFNADTGASAISVPADSLTYLVNDPAKACPADQKGCRAFGRPILEPDTGQVVAYDTAYLLSNPDVYPTTLCTANAVGCQQWTSSSEGLTFFKDPGNRTCEYRLVAGTGEAGWFKTGSTSLTPDCPTQSYTLGISQPAKSCVGGNRAGASCKADAECGAGKCEPWVGLCSANDAACTAFVDPQSSQQNNLLPNGNFDGYFKVCSNFLTPCQKDSDCSGQAGGCNLMKPYFWNLTSTDLGRRDNRPTLKPGDGVLKSTALTIAANQRATQIRNVNQNTLYTLSGQCKECAGGQLKLVVTGRTVFSQFDNSVTINKAGTGQEVILPMSNSAGEFKKFTGRVFASADATDVEILLGHPGTYDNLEFKKTGVYYYTDKNLDRTACNGLVDSDQGCVLFNDTSESYRSYSSQATAKGSAPSSCSGADCDANVILKVTADRTCSAWLDCLSSRTLLNYQTGLKEDLCQAIAPCDSLNPINGKCNHYPEVNQAPLEFDSASVDLLKYYSGLAKVGFSWGGDVKVAGYYPYGVMPQKKICVAPVENFGTPCLADSDCQTSDLAHDGVCQPVLSVADNEDRYGSCRIYPESGSPRWGNMPVDTGAQPAKSIVVDNSNPLAGFSSLTPSQLNQAAECTYTSGQNVYQGMYGYCVEKDPRSEYLCLNWLPVDELTGGWLAGAGWVDNLRKPLYMCAEGTALEVRPEIYEFNKCYRHAWYEAVGTAWSIISTVYTGGAAPAVSAGTGAYKYLEDESCGGVICPAGYIPQVAESSCGRGFSNGRRCRWRCIADKDDYYYTDEANNKWYRYYDRVDLKGQPTKKHLMYCPECNGTDGVVMWDPELGGTALTTQNGPKEWQRICTNVVKVVDSDGSNAGWKERLEAVQEFQDRKYQVPDWDYLVDTATRPFGSAAAKLTGEPTSWPLLLDKVSASQFASPLYPSYPGDSLFSLMSTSDAGQYYHNYFDNADSTVPVETFAQGRERIKRLFAQSFGYWNWTGANYQEIAKDESRCLGGTKDGSGCADNTACQDNISTCQFNQAYCGYQKTYTGGVTQWDYDSNLSCGSDSYCVNQVFCATRSCYSDDGNDDNDSGRACDDSHPCANNETCGTAPAGGYGHCEDTDPNDGFNESKIPCTKTNEKDICISKICTAISATSGFCSAGLNAGEYCANNTACSKEIKCLGRCSANSAKSGSLCSTGDPTNPNDDNAECLAHGVCTKFNYWTPPTELCPGNRRPSYFTDNPADPLGAGDWCGVAPEIYNLKVENQPGGTFEISHGSGSVTLNFNLKVDNDQLPLRTLEIDWGDGLPNTLADPRLGMFDKRDAANPFEFSHTYTYEGPAASRDFTVKIRAKDNWGWCTGEPVPVRAVNGQCPAAAWITVPTTVRVWKP